MVRDSANTEDILPASPEFLDDQARCLLEDMPVKAIKVGPVYTLETVSIIAQIAADYSDVPLIWQPAAISGESLADDIDAEDVQAALLELLLPQARIVVTRQPLLATWSSQGLIADGAPDRPGQALLELGADWVLSGGIALRAGQAAHILEGPDGYTRSWTHAPLPAGLHDREGPLACAVAAALAGGLSTPDAVELALANARPLVSRHFKPGMGRPFYDRTALPAATS